VPRSARAESFALGACGENEMDASCIWDLDSRFGMINPALGTAFLNDPVRRWQNQSPYSKAGALFIRDFSSAGTFPTWKPNVANGLPGLYSAGNAAMVCDVADDPSQDATMFVVDLIDNVTQVPYFYLAQYYGTGPSFFNWSTNIGQVFGYVGLSYQLFPFPYMLTTYGQVTIHSYARRGSDQLGIMGVNGRRIIMNPEGQPAGTAVLGGNLYCFSQVDATSSLTGALLRVLVFKRFMSQKEIASVEKQLATLYAVPLQNQWLYLDRPILIEAGRKYTASIYERSPLNPPQDYSLEQPLVGSWDAFPINPPLIGPSDPLPVTAGLIADFDAAKGCTDDAGQACGSGGLVRAWADQGPSGFSAQMTNPAYQPPLVANVFGTKPGLTFNGGQFLATTTNLPAFGDVSVFVAFIPTNPAANGNQRLIDARYDDGISFFNEGTAANWGAVVCSTGAAPYADFLPAATNAPHVVSIVRNNATSTATIGMDGARAPTLRTRFNTGGSYPLGIACDVGGGAAFTGKIGRILIYGRALSEAERVQVENFLMLNYNLAPAAPAVILPGAPFIIKSDLLQPELFRVIGISEEEKQKFGVLAINYNASKFAAVDNNTTLDPQQISQLPVPYMVGAPTIGTATITFVPISGVADTFQEQLDVNWNTPADPMVISYLTRYRKDEGNWITFNGDTSATNAFFNIDGFGTYEIEVRSINKNRIVSAPFYTSISYTQTLISTPSVTPASQTFTSGSPPVCMVSVDVGSTARYTLDGSEPTSNSSEWPKVGAVYGNLTMPGTINTTLKVKAFFGAFFSQTMSVQYTLAATPAAPTAPAVSIGSNKPPGTAATITLACALSGATIRYSLNGAALATYSAPFALAKNGTVVCHAEKAGYTNGPDSYYENTSPPVYGGGIPP